MGRQINFFLHTDDQDEFDKFLKPFGDVILLPYYHYNNKISTVADTIVYNLGVRQIAFVKKNNTNLMLLITPRLKPWAMLKKISLPNGFNRWNLWQNVFKSAIYRAPLRPK